MYIKNRRNSNKLKDFGSSQTLCLPESFVLRNRLLFIYVDVDAQFGQSTCLQGFFRKLSGRQSRGVGKRKERSKGPKSVRRCQGESLLWGWCVLQNAGI